MKTTRKPAARKPVSEAAIGSAIDAVLTWYATVAATIQTIKTDCRRLAEQAKDPSSPFFELFDAADLLDFAGSLNDVLSLFEGNPPNVRTLADPLEALETSA